MVKMLPKRKKSAPKRRIGAKNRGQDATENYKFGRVERFDNLSKNKGFGEVLHVKKCSQKRRIWLLFRDIKPVPKRGKGGGFAC